MQLYPAIKASMGTWTYYIVKMRMKEVAAEVKFGSQVHNDFTLDEAIQRAINERRVKHGIMTYLTGRSDHFFSSLVVAAVGGSPKFHPVRISDEPQYEIFADEEHLNESFGVLRFSGGQIYYALDGQHRLKAIKSLLEPEQGAERVSVPQGFADEEISVLMVIRPSDVAEEEWLTAYRRLFSSLNRYAKPTDTDTNIIMDEDDTVAILTRRLIAEHNFFQSSGRHMDSLLVQTKGKALKEGSSYFTSLQQLYDLNEILLTTHMRSNLGWGPENSDGMIADIKKFKLFRPSETYLDQLFDELVVYWDALIESIPDLRLKPSEARNHNSEGAKGETADNTLFWPIGQEVMANVARALLDEIDTDNGVPTLPEARDALSPLGRIDWNLRKAPWRGLLLVSTFDRRSERRKWTMRNETRNEAIATGTRVLRWLVGWSQLDSDEEERLRDEWIGQLQPDPGDDTQQLWTELRDSRDSVD